MADSLRWWFQIPPLPPTAAFATGSRGGALPAGSWPPRARPPSSLPRYPLFPLKGCQLPCVLDPLQPGGQGCGTHCGSGFTVQKAPGHPDRCSPLKLSPSWSSPMSGPRCLQPPHVSTSSQALSMKMERRPQVWLGSCSLEVTHFILGASWTSQEHGS